MKAFRWRSLVTLFVAIGVLILAWWSLGHVSDAGRSVEELAAQLEVKNTPVASTHHRQERLTALVESEHRLNPEDLKLFFADTEGGALAINRKDFGGITSNGCAVMAPAHGRLWVVHGPADEGTWIELSLGASANVR